MELARRKHCACAAKRIAAMPRGIVAITWRSFGAFKCESLSNERA